MAKPAAGPDAALVADILNRAGRNRTHGQILPVVLELLAQLLILEDSLV